MDTPDAVALRIVEACLAFDDPAERAAQVEVRTRGDPGLAARVRTLLDRAGKPFRLLSTESFSAITLAPMPVPDRIGPFRVISVIDDGGMGTVVRAERGDGIYEQTVAIKLIRADIADAAAHERFDAERRILAALRHPGIAHVVDGGEIDGRPWLAMEFVEGGPITVALDRAVAGRDARIEAFLGVCAAVSFAHRNLVVHADIKPGNALARPDGAIKLVDFGIARLIVDLDPEEVGTPYPLTRGYAAPERAKGAPPTIAGDVYSLGVLLHEILIGDLPGAKEASAVDLDRDLAAIIARAIASDPADRYPDVAALVADIAAWRDHFPVAARRDAGTAYHLVKFLRRYRTGVIATGSALLLLGSSALVSTALYLNAERARAQAEARFLEVRKLSRFLLFDLYDQLAASPGTVEARIRLAAEARRYLDQLRAVPHAPIDLRLDSAMSYRRLAMVQGVSGVSSLGDIAAARRSLDLAQTMLDRILADEPRNAAALAERGWVDANRWTLGSDTSDNVARNASAASWFARALAADPRSASAAIGRLTAEKNRGYDLIWTRNKPREAAGVLRAALAELHRLNIGARRRDEVQHLEFTLLTEMGNAAYYGGDPKGALGFYRAAEAIAAKESGRHETPSWLASLAQAAWNVGGSLEDDRAALTKLEAGRRAVERALSYGPDASAEKLLLVLLGEEANRMRTTGNADAALTLSQRSIGLREERLGRAPGDPLRARDLAIALPAHADVLAAVGQRDAACLTARRGAKILDELRASRRLGTRDIEVDIPKAAKAVAAHCW